VCDTFGDSWTYRGFTGNRRRVVVFLNFMHGTLPRLALQADKSPHTGSNRPQRSLNINPLVFA
jgi:hypothetical protein